MEEKMKKLLLAGIAALSVFAISSCHKAGTSSTASGSASGESALDAATTANEKVEKVAAITDIGKVKGTRIFVVGDSTLSAFNDPYYYPRYGYGTKIQDYLNADKATVINLAMSGRSSKSFTTEANYETLKKNIKKGDYLIIGFGHNDEKSEEARVCYCCETL
jgi:lysophospholipase L1-like esterase